MSKFRLILFPFAVVYDGITRIKNFLFNKRILQSYSFDIPLIVIGNLVVGGTGKTPHTEFIARLLQSKYKTAVLSRGYGRNTKGYFLANPDTDSETIGDEPLQIYNNANNIYVAVNEDRSAGVMQLKEDINPEVVILDDAFQHRKIQGSLYILLSTYENLFYNDFVLPAGNLRETAQNKKRADIIIITKCPDQVSEQQQKSIIQKINPEPNQQIFFSKIFYQTPTNFHGSQTWKPNVKVLLVTGIVNPTPLRDHLTQLGAIVHVLSFKDHHRYSQTDIDLIRNKMQELGESTVLVTTSKDQVKLKPLLQKYDPKKTIEAFEIAIQVGFLFDQENDFKKNILTHVDTI